MLLSLVEEVSRGEVKALKAWEGRDKKKDLDRMTPAEADAVLRRIHDIVLAQSAESDRLHAHFLDRGNIVSLLEDVRSLSPATRRAKWEGEAEERERERELQIESAERTMRLCAARSGARTENREAWRRVEMEGRLGGGVLPLLDLSKEELMRKSPLFWKGLPLEEMRDDFLMRASMGRIDALLCEYGRGRFPEALGRRYDEHLGRLAAGAVAPIPAKEQEEQEKEEEEEGGGGRRCGCLPLRCSLRLGEGGRGGGKRAQKKIGTSGVRDRQNPGGGEGWRSAQCASSRSSLTTPAAPTVGTSSTARAPCAPSGATRAAAYAGRYL